MIALEHLEPGHEVVPQGHGLCGLEVGEARHDRLRLAIGHVEQGDLETADLPAQGVDLVPKPQADVRRDLIVA